MPNPTPSFIPDNTFICEDTNGDGKIDRVTITMTLGAFDAVGAGTSEGRSTDQRIRITQTVDLLNVH